MRSNTPLIIVGMHRSGTSLVASLLQSSGLHIGKKLLGKGTGNVKGHFENVDFFEFHKAVLQSQGVSEHGWTLQDNISVEKSFVEQAQQTIANNIVEPYWGWKNPRTTLFLDFWRSLLPNAKFLLIYRAPWEVVDSLYRRGTDPIFFSQPDLAVKIWIYYNSKIKEFYDNYSDDCLLVNIDSIVNNGQGYIDAINYHFKLQLSCPNNQIYEASLFKKCKDCYKPTLINQHFPEAINLYQEIEARQWQLEGNDDTSSWQNLVVEHPHKSQIFRDWHTSSYINAQSDRVQQDLNPILNELEKAESTCHHTTKQLEEIRRLVQPYGEQLRKSKSRTLARQVIQFLEPLEKQTDLPEQKLAKVKEQLIIWQEKIKDYPNK